MRQRRGARGTQAGDACGDGALDRSRRDAQPIGTAQDVPREVTGHDDGRDRAHPERRVHVRHVHRRHPRLPAEQHEQHRVRIRERFSFLPDLFLDEVPPLNDDPVDLFRSPLFTLKLLATLPPEQLAAKIAPTQNRALVWDRFEHPPVRDFLEAVWHRLDGSLTMKRLVPGKGPELILGAIHLLRRLGSIDCEIQILLEDVPILSREPTDEELALYADLKSILEHVDGKLTIFNIAKKVKIDPSVLVTVFTELHKREIITFKE